MLYIGDGLLLNYLNANDKYNLEELVNKKIFTISDSPLTYRQANSLSEDNLLPDDREKKEGWHKFNLKELLYVLIISDLKNFGLKHTQLQPLWESFFEKEEGINSINSSLKNMTTADIAIGCILGGVEMVLTIEALGNVDYYFPSYFLLLKKDSPCIVLKLSTYLNTLLQKMGKDPISIDVSIDSIFLSKELLPKEEELISIIRDRKYSAIRIKKKEHDSYVIYAESKMQNKSNLTEEDVLRILKVKNYQDISIIKRDGKIVSYKTEETIKI